jgi:hypothetical protein
MAIFLVEARNIVQELINSDSNVTSIIQSQPEHQSPQQQSMLQNQPLPQQQQYVNNLTSTSFLIYGRLISIVVSSLKTLSYLARLYLTIPETPQISMGHSQ